MKPIAMLGIFLTLIAGVTFNILNASENDVSFSEIEKTYADLDVDKMESKLVAIRDDLKNAKNPDTPEFKNLNRRQVVLTKMLIFKKRGQL